MEEHASTEFGLEKHVQLKEIERAMAAEKHEQDKEQMTLKTNLTNNDTEERCRKRKLEWKKFDFSRKKQSE